MISRFGIVSQLSGSLAHTVFLTALVLIGRVLSVGLYAPHAPTNLASAPFSDTNGNAASDSKRFKTACFLTLLQLRCIHIEICLRVWRRLDNQPYHSGLHAQRCFIRAFRCRSWPGNQYTLSNFATLSPSHNSWWSVHLGMAASLGNFHPTRTSHSAVTFCQRSKWKNRHLLHCIGPETCGSRNASHPHFHALNHPVLSRIALMPPLYPSVRFDQILLDRCLRPHVCLSSDIFRTLESQI